MDKSRYNELMSEKYGLRIYDTDNMQHPYFVAEWDGCYSEDEIAHPETITDWGSYCPTLPNYPSYE